MTDLRGFALYPQLPTREVIVAALDVLNDARGIAEIAAARNALPHVKGLAMDLYCAMAAEADCEGEVQ